MTAAAWSIMWIKSAFIQVRKLIILINVVYVKGKEMSRRAFYSYERKRLTPFYEVSAPLDIIGGFQNFLTNTTNYVINQATPQVITSARSALDTYVQRFNEYLKTLVVSSSTTSRRSLPKRRK